MYFKSTFVFVPSVDTARNQFDSIVFLCCVQSSCGSTLAQFFSDVNHEIDAGLHLGPPVQPGSFVPRYTVHEKGFIFQLYLIFCVCFVSLLLHR